MSAAGSWVEVEQPDVWDAALAAAGGHPLQSALWGHARRKVDGIAQLFLAYRDAGDGTIGGLARVELRKAAGLTVGWIPKGPSLSGNAATRAGPALLEALTRRGLSACISNPYDVCAQAAPDQPMTIWLDLAPGLEQVERGMDSRWRYGVRRALRDGVVVEPTTSPDKVAAFYGLCHALSIGKKFKLPGSEALMQALVASSAGHGPVSATLYVAEMNAQVVSGALIAQCGRHVHYLWGASDRRFSKHCVSEAVQWRVIQDAVDTGATRYDLEGIDPAGNPGVYEFKRKLGGREVTLHGMDIVPLTFAGGVAVAVGRAMGRFG